MDEPGQIGLEVAEKMVGVEPAKRLGMKVGQAWLVVALKEAERPRPALRHRPSGQLETRTHP
jgi:hypothetical protein